MRFIPFKCGAASGRHVNPGTPAQTSVDQEPLHVADLQAAPSSLTIVIHAYT